MVKYLRSKFIFEVLADQKFAKFLHIKKIFGFTARQYSEIEDIWEVK